MEEEKKAAAGVDWAEKAPAAPRRRSRKKSAAKGKPKKSAAPAEPKQQPAVSDTPETPAETAPAPLQVPEAPDAPQPNMDVLRACYEASSQSVQNGDSGYALSGLKAAE